jgi:pSer/pThr/pTyr-binding forkhead associated (FHA) protein
MRFCNNCGFQLGGGQPAPIAVQQDAQAAFAQPAAPPVGAGPRAGSPYGAQPAPVCWRCRSLGESGADFCKFCGARYADGAAAQQPAPQAAPGQAYAAAPQAQGFGGPGPASSVASALAGYGQQAPMQAAPMQAAPMQPAMQAAPMQPAMQAAPMQAAPMQAAPMQPAMQAAPMPAAPVAEAPRTTYGNLVAILKDGSDGRAYPIVDDPTDLGRTEGHVVLADDPYLSSRHARLVPRPDGLLVRDLDSINGIYVRVREPVELNDGDLLLLGQQLVRFELLPETELPLGPAMHRGVLVFGTPEVPRLARLVQYTTEGVGRDVHYIYRDETVIGREQGDVVCTDDPFMSRRHAAIALDRSARRFVLRDLGSSNGTAVRIRGERLLKTGDQFRVGRHLFRYDRAGASA